MQDWQSLYQGTASCCTHDSSHRHHAYISSWLASPPLVLQVFVTLMVSVQYQVKRVLLYEDGPPPAAVSTFSCECVCITLSQQKPCSARQL
jgi:hypothetical protein